MFRKHSVIGVIENKQGKDSETSVFQFIH